MEYEVLSESGPASGWPEVEVRGERDALVRFLVTHSHGDVTNDAYGYAGELDGRPVYETHEQEAARYLAEFGQEIGS